MPVGVMRSIGVSVRSTNLDVGLVVDLEIAAFERDAASAEAVGLRDQLLGYDRVFDPLARFAGDEIGDQPVGLPIDQDVAEIAHPDAEPGLAVVFSQNASRSSSVTSSAERGSVVWIKQPKVSWQRAKISE